ncbi:unnamed protein product [Gongylonema pulchrum]|uniref:Uncharacterized protein n=1 Tax=Gongylonema pulchrum TaxID=637853 RepID=A0A3P6QYR9_9BILA|nr:unnamed protein product [Gongylonema pulchrum]
MVYNSETYQRLEVVELLVSSPLVGVTGDDGPVRAQIEPYFDSVTGEFKGNYLIFSRQYCE